MRVLNDRTAPDVWPVCPACSRPYVFRRLMTPQSAPQWRWSADCRHTVPPVLTTARGRVEPSDEPWSAIAMADGLRVECHRCSWVVHVFDEVEGGPDAVHIEADRLARGHGRCHEQAG